MNRAQGIELGKSNRFWKGEGAHHLLGPLEIKKRGPSRDPGLQLRRGFLL